MAEGVKTPQVAAPAVKTPDLVSHFSILAGDQPRLGTNVFTFLMNSNSYNKLPKNLRAVIDKNSGGNIAARAGKNWDAIEAPGLAVVKSKKKNKFHTIPATEVAKMKAAAQPVFERWFAEMKKIGVDGPALLADARDLIAKHSK